MNRADIIVDLGYGDGGKGTLTDALAARHRSDLVVRFNGGGQAGHNVVLSDGRSHTFSHFGAATFQPGVGTFWSRFCVLNPLGALAEAAHLESAGIPDALERFSIDARVWVTTPAHQALNHIREVLRGAGRHGSCGIGFGETVCDGLSNPHTILRARELRHPDIVRQRALAARDRLLATLPASLDELRCGPYGDDLEEDIGVLTDVSVVDAYAYACGEFAARVRILEPPEARRLIRDSHAPVFEGAQGVLIDEWHGFHPHTTWSTTTYANALELLEESEWEGQTQRWAVHRTHMVRHGAGPMPGHTPSYSDVVEEAHNTHGAWQGGVRHGPLDLTLLRYALSACGGADRLCLTHVDALERGLPGEFIRYELPKLTPNHARNLLAQQRLGEALESVDVRHTVLRGGPRAWCRQVADLLDMTLGCVSRGPTRQDKALLTPL